MGMTIVKTIRQYFSGGVDFTEIPMTEIPYEQLLAKRPEIQEQLFNALCTLGGHWNGEVWLGGIYVVGVP